MIRVFFERKGYAELVAVFMDEHTYNNCLEKLERLCKDMGFDRLTESIEYSQDTEDLINVMNKL
jgi:hypothetical protein